MKPVNLRIFFRVCVLIVTLAACHSRESAKQTTSGVVSERLPHVLSRLAAADRAAVVKDVHYDLSFRFDAVSETFSGEARIAFSLAAPSKDSLAVDFYGGTITSVMLNGVTVSPQYNGAYLSLPAATLKAGENTAVIAFTHSYATNGSGLYRFKDSEDGRVYLYTDFEPYNANLLFPCFDQPDIKGIYAVSVEVPGDWNVISTTRETKIEAAGETRKLWRFSASQPIATYVFSLHAGPYHVWEDATGDVPLRLFARESLAKYVAYDEWLTITRQGLKFYQDYFAVPYPFKKYDQVIVPDFNSGAMENVAAVTFSEDLVYRGKADYDERQDRADGILHEMAHMWFGNLVTMRWWNGLWLNESFATYMAALSATQATEFKNSWLTFNASMKEWGYFEDGLTTSHPIETPVRDTGEAFANFDGITYGKGASVLKQLAFFVGPDKFRDGVRVYLKEHAFGNATLDDFVSAVATASGVDLKRWSDEWLNKTGVNTVTAAWHCEADKITAFSILQNASQEFPALRTHRTQIAFYQELPDGNVVRQDVVPATYSGAQTAVAELVGKSCPAAVQLNFDDQDYAEESPDAVTRDFILAHVSKIPDPLARRQFWHALWQDVRGARLPVQRYLDAVMEQLPKEADFSVTNAVLATVYGKHTASASALRYLPDEKTANPTSRERAQAAMAAFFRERLDAAVPGSDFQRLWFDAYVAVARGVDAENNILAMLEGKIALPGFEIDQDRRWHLIVKLNSLKPAGREDLVAAELVRDKSSAAKKMAIAAEAVRPDPQVKRKWFDEITASDASKSLAELEVAMEALFPLSQSELALPFISDFYARLLELSKTRDDEYLENFVANVTPDACGKETTAPLHRFIRDNPKLSPVVLKGLKMARQEQARCLVARQVARDYAKQAQR